MTRNLIDFDSGRQLLSAEIGTWAHDGDKYPNLKFRVGKRKRTWTFRGRINGDFSSLVLGEYPDMKARDAMAALRRRTRHEAQEDTGAIRTVRDAWEHHCETSKANGKISDRTRADLTAKLEKYAPSILKAHPTDVSRVMIQKAVNAIDTGRGKNSAATKRHVRAALVSAFNVLEMPNPAKGVSVPKANSRSPIWYELSYEHRHLDPDDLSTVWRAIKEKRDQNILIGTAWVVMLFTGIRCGDVCAMRWERDDVHPWVDLQRKSITFPKLKSGVVQREVPVCDTVIRAFMAIRSAGSAWVFPASTKTGYIGGEDGLDALKTDVEGVGRVPVVRAHDTRGFFQEASNEALLPEHVMWFLRGDSKGDGSMLAKYTRRVGKTPGSLIEMGIVERIKETPEFS